MSDAAPHTPLPEAPAAAAGHGALPRRTVVLYGLPMLGLGFAFFLTSVYLLKFATDVLGIAPATMGLLLFVSRVWDAVSDPLAGYLSDRTRTRFGRRRPWMAAGVPLAVLSFALLWAPPERLPAAALAVWMGAMIVLFYTAMTVYGMPFDALGAELTSDYHERNRLFGTKRLCFGLGAIPVFFAMDAIAGAASPRALAAALMLPAAVVAGILMLAPVVGLRERADYVGRGSTHPLRAMRDVWANVHARRLLAVFFLQQLGVAAITVTVPYFAEYVLREPEAVSWILGTFFVASIVSIPVWLRLGRRFEKRTLLLACMWVIGAAILGLVFVGPGMLPLVLSLTAVAGMAGGCLDVLFPSVQADVIDTDEHRTGERKEGMFFAAWHFSAKTAVGIAGMAVGFLLQSSGFEPNVAQDERALLMIRLLTGALPFACYLAGTLVFRGFALTKDAHDEIRRALDARAG